MDLSSVISGAAQPQITRTNLAPFEVALPPLEVQEEIVKELEGYQAVIDGAQKVIDNWKPTVQINPNWEKVKLKDIISLSSGDFLPSKLQIEGKHFVYGGNGVNGTHNSYNTETKTIVIGRVGAYCGCIHITKEKSWVTDNALKVQINSPILNERYLALSLEALNLHSLAKVGGQPSISQTSVLEQNILLPSLEIQNQIVEKIQEEEKAIEECKKLIEIHKQKINDKIQSIWGNE